MWPLSYFQHRHDCRAKQHERQDRIAFLDPKYHKPISQQESDLLSTPISILSQDIRSKHISPLDILLAYSKASLSAHKRTNCLTEIIIPSSEIWIRDVESSGINLQGSLAGIPISLKDTINVGGYDTSVGFSGRTFKPALQDGGLVRLLKSLGAVPFVKTALPITLLSFESSNDLWGRCSNPHNKHFSPGGSTGGEAALLAFGGSRIGIGSDVAGSVRLPAHWSGCFALRCSIGRFPKAGIESSMPGQEGVPSVFSPMARSMGDLKYFMKAVIDGKPWDYDPTVHPITWRKEIDEHVMKKKRLKIGVMRSDGVVDPSPACARALERVVSALKAQGHVVIDILPPTNATPYQALVLGSQLLNADGTQMFSSFFRTGEKNDPGAAQVHFYMNLPFPVRYLYYLYIKHIKRDNIWAGLVYNLGPKSAYENWQLVAKREAMRNTWFEWWNDFTFPPIPSSSSSLSTLQSTNTNSSFSSTPSIISAPSSPCSFDDNHSVEHIHNDGKTIDDGEEKMDFFLTVPHASPALPHGAMANAVSSCGYTFLFNILDWTAGVLPVTYVDSVLDRLPDDVQVGEMNGVAKGVYMYYDSEKMDGLPVGVQVVGRRLQEEKVLSAMSRIGEALNVNETFLEKQGLGRAWKEYKGYENNDDIDD